MKRKLKWTAVVLGALLFGFGTALFLWPRDRITPESWKQIRLGMSEKQVEEILGGPGMSEKQCAAHFHKTVELWEPKSASWLLRFESAKYWVGRRGEMQLSFDAQDCVSGKAFWTYYETSFIDRLRDWLGW